jgi:hypothetical protein
MCAGVNTPKPIGGFAGAWRPVNAVVRPAWRCPAVLETPSERATRAHQRGHELSQRRQGLSQFRQELALGKPVTIADGERAARYAAEAQEHTERASHSAAAAHDRVATLHDYACKHNIGDAAAHQRAATAHRAAAVSDRQGAKQTRPRDTK